MAIVADEYGGTAGLVTLGDLVEERADEHDRILACPYCGWQTH